MISVTTFFNLSHHEIWFHRNDIGRVIAGSQAVELGGSFDKRYHVALVAFGMGDLSAVDIAQRTHERVLERFDCMREHEHLEFGKPSPESVGGAIWEGVYVDGHLISGVLPKCLLGNLHGEDMELLERSRAAYKAANLDRNDSKAFVGKRTFTCWGIEVSSATGGAAAPRAKRLEIMMVGFLGLCRRSLDTKSLQSLLGLCVHPFMMRRECMCTLGRVYRWLAPLPDAVSLDTPSDICDDFLVAFLHLPIAQCNIRAQVSISISCSDATPTRGGTVGVVVSEKLSRDLFRYAEAKGRYVHLDWKDSSPNWQLWGHRSPPRHFQFAHSRPMESYQFF